MKTTQIKNKLIAIGTAIGICTLTILVSIPGLFEPPVRTLRATVPVVEPVIR